MPEAQWQSSYTWATTNAWSWRVRNSQQRFLIVNSLHIGKLEWIRIFQCFSYPENAKDSRKPENRVFPPYNGVWPHSLSVDFFLEAELRLDSSPSDLD